MLRYLIRRNNDLYVEGYGPRDPVTWTRHIGWAHQFKTKREAFEWLAAAKLPGCEVVATAWVTNDVKLELVSRRTDVLAITVSDPGGNSTKPGPTNTGLAYVGKMANLEQLDISFYSMTDVGLLHLRRLIGLRKLKIRGGQVTERGIEKLRTILVDCDIVWIPTSRVMPTANMMRPTNAGADIKQKVNGARIARQEELAEKRQVVARKKASAAKRKKAKNSRNSTD